VISALKSQGDEVRVVESDPERADGWRKLGAYVAMGAADDPDLVERAAHSCRTIVLFDIEDADSPMVEAILAGIAPTTVDRVVVLASDRGSRCLDLLRSHQLDFVFLRTPRRTLLRRAPTPGAIAEAVDAADDLVGNPRLELDLSDPGAARALGLGVG
jgi:hypothetical protein